VSLAGMYVHAATVRSLSLRPAPSFSITGCTASQPSSRRSDSKLGHLCIATCRSRPITGLRVFQLDGFEGTVTLADVHGGRGSPGGCIDINWHCRVDLPCSFASPYIRVVKGNTQRRGSGAKKPPKFLGGVSHYGLKSRCVLQAPTAVPPRRGPTG